MLLESSRYEELNQEVVDLLEAYGLSRFPLDVFALAAKMGICLRSYTSIPLAKRPAFDDVSRDAFTISPGDYEVDTTFICYNPDANPDRMRQSIAHEVAHIWLEHPSSEEPYETEAEYFAAYLLAPIPLLLKNKISTPFQVQEAFCTSHKAATISVKRANNRRRCGKPASEYEWRLIEMCTLEGGGYLESA